MSKVKVLFAGTIPNHIPSEIRKERESNFNKEMFEIAERYSAIGHIFNRVIDLPVQHFMGDDSVMMFEFPEELNIPKAMQKEIAKAWSKIWEH
jgi:hypothetical protein